MFQAENWKTNRSDLGIMLASLFGAVILCILLRDYSDDETYVSLIFVLCVLLVSLKTSGYLCGTITSVIGVLAVNYMFTYPYMQLEFRVAGYPLTFVTMLTVSLITSTLATNVKREEKLRIESERERMRANLLRAVSHDLRSPLTSISGSVAVVLENDNLPEKQKRELLSGVKEDAEWLIRMVENLLSVTRIGLDEARVEKTMEAGEEVIFAAVSKFRKRFPGVTVESKVPDDFFLVPMDPVLIEQVLSNLLENAVLHGSSTKIWVTLDNKDGKAQFTVRDNGTGIRPDVLPHILDDYYMLAEKNKSTAMDTYNRRSMGIGLSVCISIIKAHGGMTNAYNHIDGGACFTFTLPLNQE